MSSPQPIRRQAGHLPALMLTGLARSSDRVNCWGMARRQDSQDPAAIWAWVLGALIVTTVALTYAELGAMFPESGGMVSYGSFPRLPRGVHRRVVELDRGCVRVDSVEAEASVPVHGVVALPVDPRSVFSGLPDGHGELSLVGRGGGRHRCW